MKFASKVAVGALVVTTGFGTLAFTGQDNLDNVKTMYNNLYDNYKNALSNIGMYRSSLADKIQALKDAVAARDELLAERQQYEDRIAELNATIEQLQAQGGDNAEQIAQLEAEKAALQEELDNCIDEDEWNQLTAEIERLQNELTKSNEACEALENELKAKPTLTDTKLLTGNEEELTGGDIKLYLTFAMSSNYTSKNPDADITVLAALDNLHLIDSHRISPVLLYTDSTPNSNQYWYYLDESTEDKAEVKTKMLEAINSGKMSGWTYNESGNRIENSNIVNGHTVVICFN